MKNMTGKEKFLFIFLQIITLGLIWIYWKKQYQKQSDEQSLSQKNNSTIDANNLMNLLGTKENIENVVSTHTKIKIFYKDRSKILIDEIKNTKGISGVFINDTFIVIIVGKTAESLKEQLLSI